MSPLTIDVESSVLNVEGAAFVMPGRRLRTISNIIQYRGRDNVYNEDARAYLALEPARRVAENRMRLGGLSTLPEWLAYWDLSDGNARTQAITLSDNHERLHTETSEALEGELKVVADVQNCGVDQNVLGPGTNYQTHLRKDAYERWAKEAAAMLASLPETK